VRALLLIGGGVESVPGIERAKELDLRVAVLDGDPQAPGFALADQHIVLSTYDTGGAVAAARALPRLDGVLSVATDVTRTVAAVAAALGLEGPSAETAELSSDKLLMKERFAEAGVPIPRFAAVESAGDVAALLRDWGTDLVVKPVDSRGARGVTRVRDPVDAASALGEALQHSPSGRAMAEEHLSGPQISSETLFVDGTAYTPGFSDRNYARLAQFAPHFIEDGGTQPSELAAGQQRELRAVAEAAGRALGVRSGPCKGDLVWNERRGRAEVIEAVARLSGGWFCTDQIPLATGVDLVGCALRVALGERPAADELRPRRRRAVALRYAFPGTGRVLAVPDPGRIEQLPGIERARVFARVGDELAPPTDHTRRPGCVIATAPTRAEAVARAESGARAMEHGFDLAAGANATSSNPTDPSH
jgi:biotin carboxylase